MEKLLRLYKFVDGVNDSPFPNATQQAILYEFRYDAKRMGNAPTISGTLMHPLCLDNLWGNDLVYIVYNSERYFLKQTPTSSYSNEDTRYKHEVDFVSERIVLNDVYFYDVVQGDANIDKPVSNSSSFTFYGDIHEFAQRLNYSLQYAKVGYSVVVDEGISSEAKMISFQNQFIANALQESYNTYEIPYYFVGKVIHIGFTDNAITRTFKYGIDDALLSITKSNANYKVVNRATGTGSSDNIPYYYPNKYESKEQVEAEGGTWIPPQTNLMPPIYRESLGDERFYNALNGAYINPQTNDYYEFANPYQDGKPKEQIVSFDDIKPSIVGITNASGARIDMFSDFAYDRNDNDETDEEGNYLHPYFFAKLRKFNGAYGFNLFEHAIEEDEMVISMTSGNCGACNFVIGVDSETQKNTVQVDENGNLLRDDDGNILFGSPQDRQNDTQNYEVWIALRKDIETFGVIMPNATNNYKPNAGDTFVILHIDLPQSYIEAAENRLKEEIIKYMAMNNSEKFTFSITFSRIFFAENLDVLAQLNENARLQIEYNNKTYELYVSSYSYNMTSDKALPEIRVELSDTLTITQNALQTAISEVKTDIMNSVGSIDWLRLGLKYFLRKDTNDRSRGKVASDVGFEVGKFVSGASGAIVYVDKTTGQTVAELDKLYVRMKAYFETLEIINANSVGGKQIISPAGSIKCIDVKDRMVDASGNEIVWDYYRCYFLSEQDGEKVENRFVVGDQAYSQLFNAQSGVSNNISNKYYWRLVVGVGENYIDLSKSDCDSGSDVPEVGDVICHRGNRNDVDRQNVIEVSSVDTFSPSITLYQGINSYSLSGKDIVSFGVDKTTNKAFMNVYGDMYVGDRNNTSYMRYTQENGLELKGRLAVGTTLSDGRELEQAIKDATPEGYNEFVEKVLGDLGSLQQQVDGAIDSYFYEYAPTLDNYPANEWDTDAEKEAHLNDTFTNLLDGRSWRWTTAGWVEITDTATTKALAIAGQAKDIADGKRRVFIDTPYPPYDLGDLWAGGSDAPLRRCINAKGENGVFEESDWDYADNTTKQLAGYEYLKRALGESTTVDGGLVQTSLLMLGYTSNGTFNVMSGTNGLYDSSKKGGGIAAWYGGPMADKEADSTLAEYAQSLFRFDGSGYLAGGNITWDKDGAGSVAGGDIAWDKDGAITLGVGIKISGDTNETLGSILTTVNKFLSWFEEDANGDIYVKPDDSGRGRNFYTYGAVSFGGLGDTSGGGEGGGSGVTSFYAFPEIGVNTSTLANGQVLTYDGEKWINKAIPSGLNADAVWSLLASDTTEQINISHIPDLSSKYLSLSGGRIHNPNAKTVLSISNTGTDGVQIALLNNGTEMCTVGDNSTNGTYIYSSLGGAGYTMLGIDRTGVAYFTNKNGVKNTLIHSSNIGEQIVNSAKSLSGIYVNSLDANQCYNTSRVLKFYNGFSSESTNIPNSNNWSNGLLEIGLNNNGNTAQFFFASDKPLYYRARVTADWKTIAFTDSNVASATKLQDNTTYTAWGQTFFENGVPKNITGTQNLIFSECTITPVNIIYISRGGGWVHNVRVTNKEDGAVLGSIGFAGQDDGLKRAYIVAGDSSSTNGLIVLGSGNVGIGTNAPKYKFHVAGVGLFGDSTDGSAVALGKKGNAIDGYYLGLYGNLYINANSQGNVYIATGGGKVGIKTNAPAYDLDVAGSLNATTIYQNGQTLDKYYLPLINAKLSSSVYNGALEIQRTGGARAATIKFSNDTNGVLGSIGIGGSTTGVGIQPYWNDGSSDYAFIHSGNIGSYNAGSATKLQTARTIWGQRFDGTGNVSGSLYLFKAVQGGWARSIYVTKSDDEILASIGFFGGTNTLNFIYIGGTYQAPHLAVFPSGNVGINIYTDNGYKLDVAGPIRTIGALIADSAKITTNIRVGGDSIYNYISAQTTEGYNNLSIDSYGDKICISGQSNTVLNVNYTKSESGWAPKTWNWYNGSSTGWANFVLGGITANGEIILADSTGSSSISHKLRFLRKTSTDNAYDFGLYAQTTKGLTFFRNLSGTDTDIAYLDNAGNFEATGGITATALTINGVGKVGGNLTTTNIYPNADASYNLGSTSKRWYQVHTQWLYANSGRIYGDLRLQPKDDDYGSHLYFGDSSLCYIAELEDNIMTLYAKRGIILTVENTKDDALKINANTYVDGNFITTGALTFGSDERYKTKLSDVSVTLEDIANAPLFNYRWNNREDNREHLGTTAQYWNKTAFKNAVCPNDEKLWTMSYSEIAMGNTIVLARELLPIKSDVQRLEERVTKLESILREHNIIFS